MGHNYLYTRSVTCFSLNTKADKLKQLLTHRRASLVVVSPFSPFGSKMARVAVIATYDSAKMLIQHHLEVTQKVKGLDWAVCMCILHADTC